MKNIVDQIDEISSCGDMLVAYDAATEALKDNPEDLTLKHRAVLYLARAGALEKAQSEYSRLGLEEVRDNEDIIALGGRLLKNVAMESAGDARRALAATAAEKYLHAYKQSGGYFSGVNSASLYLVAGEKQKSEAMAQEILVTLDNVGPAIGLEAYYQEATKAEAYVLLNQPSRAIESFHRAIDQGSWNYAARATTLRQLSMILDVSDQDSGWLDQFRPPRSAHFAGHLYSTVEGRRRLDSMASSSLENEVRTTVKNENIGFGFGALAAGSDIIIAEALIKYGAELHIILPCSDKSFVRSSVLPMGEDWVRRFENCVDAAAAVQHLAGDLPSIDNFDLGLASEVAMGLAALRARSLCTEAVQIAVLDEAKKDKTTGTSRDIHRWRQAERRQIIIPFPPVQSGVSEPNQEKAEEACTTHDRALLAMLFAEVKGYGELSSDQAAEFIVAALEPLAECCRKLGLEPRYVNTWGDGIFFAFEDVESAAATALALQDTFRKTGLSGLGLPANLSLRVSCHLGPVHTRKDPFTDRDNIFGTEVALASRTGALTLPGAIYVSEPFACALAIPHDEKYRCDYLGRVELGDGNKEFPLFSLRPADRS